MEPVVSALSCILKLLLKLGLNLLCVCQLLTLGDSVLSRIISHLPRKHNALFRATCKKLWGDRKTLLRLGDYALSSIISHLPRKHNALFRATCKKLWADRKALLKLENGLLSMIFSNLSLKKKTTVIMLVSKNLKSKGKKLLPMEDWIKMHFNLFMNKYIDARPVHRRTMVGAFSLETEMLDYKMDKFLKWLLKNYSKNRVLQMSLACTIYKFELSEDVRAMDEPSTELVPELEDEADGYGGELVCEQRLSWEMEYSFVNGRHAYHFQRYYGQPKDYERPFPTRTDDLIFGQDITHATTAYMAPIEISSRTPYTSRLLEARGVFGGSFF